MERALQALDKSATVGTLRHDPYLLFLFKKTERIVAALYMVTATFSESEPLKRFLRESGLRLVGYTMSFRERTVAHNRELLSDTMAEVTTLFSLLDLAYLADLLSLMNFSVLKKELEATIAVIEGRGRPGGFSASPPFLEESFFGIAKGIFEESKEKERETFPQKTAPESMQQWDASLHSLSEFEGFRRFRKDTYKGQSGVKDSVLEGGGRRGEARELPGMRKPWKAQIHQQASALKEERKLKILEVLHRQRNAMIKDFSSAVTGCSEKTVQRLLVHLVRDGIIAREGDRRWSRYVLAVKQPESKEIEERGAGQSLDNDNR